MNLQDKRAIVTGGSRGIGKAIVFELAQRGAKVVFTFQSSEESARLIEKEAADKGLNIFAIKADASVNSDVENSINFALEKLGGLDILVNNAGITKDNLLLRMSDEDFDKVISANLKSVFYYTKASLKPFMSQKNGRIINISSVVGITGNPGQANYVASKAGVIGFSKSVAKEVASRNITCNVIAPGFITTDMTDKLNDKQKEAILNLIPLKKIGKPENVAYLTAFLASDFADYITGQVICVDGGMTM